jgi:Apea-like HEPN
MQVGEPGRSFLCPNTRLTTLTWGVIGKNGLPQRSSIWTTSPSGIRPYALVQTRSRRIERRKVLFALMHICKADTSLDTIIWLFYALETFYDTQPGENRRALTNRIGMVLLPNDKERSYLKDSLRKLYDIRSGFVHGGREIAHPMNNSVLDNRVEGKFTELMDASEFDFASLLTSVQSAIEGGYRELSFNETMTGMPLTTND